MKCTWMLRQEPKKNPVFLASLLAAMNEAARMHISSDVPLIMVYFLRNSCNNRDDAIVAIVAIVSAVTLHVAIVSAVALHVAIVSATQ